LNQWREVTKFERSNAENKRFMIPSISSMTGSHSFVNRPETFR